MTTARARRGPVAALVAALAALASGVALVGCGIPTQRSASPVSPKAFLTRLPVTRPTISPCTKSGCTSVDVYFLAPSGRLSPVSRVVPAHPKISTVIGALLGGPSASDRAKGITTALGSRIRLLKASLTVRRKIATVDFSVNFGTLSGSQLVLGVAQVVYTVTSLLPGRSVNFQIADVQIEVPLQTGRLVTAPVRESQYSSLLTRSTTTATSTTP